MSTQDRSRKALWLGRFLTAFIGIALGFATPAAQASLLFVANPTTSSLEFFDASTGINVGGAILPGDGAYPIGVTLGPDGNIYVADNGMSAVDAYNGTTGAYIGQFIPSQNCGSGCPTSALNQPSGLVFGPDGNLYVANYGNDGSGYINVYNGTNGAFMSTFVGTAAGLSYPGGLAFDSNGNLYVANTNGGTIEEFNSSGANIGPFVPAGNPPSPLAVPESIAFGPDGNVYVVDEGSGGYIDVFSAAGGYLGQFTGSSNPFFDGPVDLTFGPGGQLYVTYSMGVAVFQGTFSGGADPESADLVSYPELNAPEFLAFGPAAETAVPEPSTPALLALGLLGLAGVRRLRRAPVSPQ
ncbi:MAG: NHL repeat-containing protein [Bryobacteraceae bacterium]|jgi:sugar lactone lactonase YvrE